MRTLLHVGVATYGVAFPTRRAPSRSPAPPTAHAAGQAREVLLTTSASGLKWGDIRPGVGNEFAPGQTVTIDYMMTKRAGAQQIPTLPWPWP